jgi:ATP-binding cassette, subfamily F, member 3
MISINHINLSFGSRVLFNDITFLIKPKDRIGLVGNNGSGKTTLLKVILGIQSADSGNIEKPTGLTIGYLPQQMKHKDDMSLLCEVKTAFSAVIELEDRLSFLNHEMSHRNDFHSEKYHKMINEMAEINTRLANLEASKINEKIEKTLQGLGFEPEDFARHTGQFSGGWRMRIELAKILLQNPDLLLLDEPTNHLDIESIMWMEQFLNEYRGGVVLISHDRAFLDNTTNRTIEISLSRIYDYRARYSKFAELRKERRQQQLAAYKNQQKEISDINRFIERFRYKNTKAVQVQSRIKYLEKLKPIEIDAEDSSSINIRFPDAPRSGDIVLEVEKLSKSYGPKNVLENIDFILTRGERVAFVGRNGEGKTTLSKILAGELDFSGKLKIGHNVKIGYFAQNQDELLNDDLTVIETIDRSAVFGTRTELRSMLGAFLFGEDDVDKKVKVLSGGERSRLALIKLLLQPHNLLILDEPTNHLDMHSKDILKMALANFKGTMILVSHDREFLENLAETIYEFREHKIRKYMGDINYFLEKKQIGSLSHLDSGKNAGTLSVESNVTVIKSLQSGKEAYNEKKEYSKLLRKTTKSIAACEEEIGRLEKELKKITGMLTCGTDSPEKTGSEPYKKNDQNIYEIYGKIQSELETKVHEWEQLHEKLNKFTQSDKWL